MGLRPAALFAIMELGFAGAWAGPALRCFEGFVVSEAAAAFERELDAIAHDGSEFGQLEIVHRHIRLVRGTTEFRVTIDRPGGVDLALCEGVAARLNGALESFAAPYSLEVESAGLERPLVRPADYARFSGQPARIVTNLTVNGGKTHRGILRGLRGQSVILETGAGELPLPVATIKSAHLEYDPRADLQRNKRERKKSHGNSRHDS
jgi:ribosome maturation factor RimP